LKPSRFGKPVIPAAVIESRAEHLGRLMEMAAKGYPWRVRVDVDDRDGEIEALVHPTGSVEISRVEFIGNATWDDGLKSVEPALSPETVKALESELRKKALDKRDES